MVAGALEADFNEKLRNLQKSQEEYERKEKENRFEMNEEKKSKVRNIVNNFPALWNNPDTPCKEKKRMVRLLLEDITLKRQDGINVSVLFKGGETKTFKLPETLRIWDLRKTDKKVLEKIDQLLNKYYDKKVVEILNREKHLTGTGKKFTIRILAQLRKNYNLKSHYERLREKKFLTLKEISEKLQVSKRTLRRWAQINQIKAVNFNVREKLYELPGKEEFKKLTSKIRQK